MELSVDASPAGVAFYTDVLGFVKKTEVPLGEHRWLTVVSPEDPDGVELVLEPDEHPAPTPTPDRDPASPDDGEDVPSPDSHIPAPSEV